MQPKALLRTLHIENYVLIDSLDIDFPESLVIVTGQTGAGKSILLGALSLLTGGKADASVIGHNADNCVVEAEFSVAADSGIYAILKDNDIDCGTGEIIFRRVISKSGRSRCFINDCPVQAALLAEASSHLLDIHSQHNSLLLNDKKFQLSLIDSYSSSKDLARECASAWRKLLGEKKELESARERLRKAGLDSDYNNAVLEKLLEAGLRPGELEELEEEHRSLANAEDIKSCLSGAVTLLESDSVSISSNLKEAVRLVERTAGFIPSLTALAKRLEEARIEIVDISGELESRAEDTTLSEERLEAVENRMSVLYSLLRKHNCASVEDLISLRDSLSELSSDSSNLELRIGELEKRVEESRKAHLEISRKLHDKRAAAAPEFAARIQESLRFLELERAVFKAELQETEDGENGRDRVCFTFSANGGAGVDVAKCASGGELSRIMLCLKQMLSKFTKMPTMIFDEIDSGVSGSVADKMGSMICDMGAVMQVLAITHLPQVAAKGNAHFVVSKKAAADGTVSSSIQEVKGEKRVEEIARLLSGASISPQALANARVLLAGD